MYSHRIIKKEINRLGLLVGQLQGSQIDQCSSLDKNILVQKMRLKYKEIKDRLYERERYIECTKKNLKFTRTQELEVNLSHIY